MHLPIEGSSPGIGNRAAASAAYQEGLCEAIAEAFDRLYAEFNEPCYFNADDENDEHEEINYNEGEEEEAGGDEDYEPSIAPEEEPEPPQPRGVLYKLGATRQQEVKRTITRLHRNLGHPTNNELAKMLEQRGASPELVEAARVHDCATVICTKGRAVFLCHLFPGQQLSMKEFSVTHFGSHHLIHDERFLC